MGLSQNENYYKLKMKNIYSINKALPGLVPELSHDNFEVGDGRLLPESLKVCTLNWIKERLTVLESHS